MPIEALELELRIDIPHASESVLHRDLGDLFGCMAFGFLEELALCRDDFLECSFEVWF